MEYFQKIERSQVKGFLHYCNKTTLFRKLGIWIFIWSWYWKFPQLLQDIFKFLQFNELSWEDISYLVTLGNINDMVLLFNSRTFYHKTSLTKENNTAERCSLNILTVKHARKHFFKLDYMIAFCIITKKTRKGFQITTSTRVWPTERINVTGPTWRECWTVKTISTQVFKLYTAERSWVQNPLPLSGPLAALLSLISKKNHQEGIC